MNKRCVVIIEIAIEKEDQPEPLYTARVSSTDVVAQSNRPRDAAQLALDLLTAQPDEVQQVVFAKVDPEDVVIEKYDHAADEGEPPVSDLLSCPFCGSQHDGFPPRLTVHRDNYMVQCGWCGSSTSSGASPHCACDSWNSRFGETAPDSLEEIRRHVEAMPKPDTKSGAPFYLTVQIAEWAHRLRELTGAKP